MGEDPRTIPWHPRQEPRVPGDLTPEHLRRVFSDCVDFREREIFIGGDFEKKATIFSILGMVRDERANDYILKPLSENGQLREMSLESAIEWMHRGGLYTMTVRACTTMDEAVFDLIQGCVILSFPGRSGVLSCSVATEEKRPVMGPENEPTLKGGRDSFVESVRTNTSLVRRRIRTPSLKLREEIVGRQTLTPVDLLYIDGLTDPELVQSVWERLCKIDIDAMLSTVNLEEYIADSVKTPFPLMAYTERPDRFCSGLVEGRVGILVDGLPMGFLLPGTIGEFLKTGEDKAKNGIEASFLRSLRILCMLVALFLPVIYVAAVNFHPEMILAPLAW